MGQEEGWGGVMGRRWVPPRARVGRREDAVEVPAARQLTVAVVPPHRLRPAAFASSSHRSIAVRGGRKSPAAGRTEQEILLSVREEGVAGVLWVMDRPNRFGKGPKPVASQFPLSVPEI